MRYWIEDNISLLRRVLLNVNLIRNIVSLNILRNIGRDKWSSSWRFSEVWRLLRIGVKDNSWRRAGFIDYWFLPNRSLNCLLYHYWIRFRLTKGNPLRLAIYTVFRMASKRSRSLLKDIIMLRNHISPRVAYADVLTCFDGLVFKSRWRLSDLYLNWRTTFSNLVDLTLV